MQQDNFGTAGMRLSGKVVLVTGGSSGIGLATASLMSAHGATVVIVGRDANKLNDALTVLARGMGPRVSGLVADVSKIADIERVMEEMAQRHGRIDVLMANAGMSDCPPIRETDEAAFDAIIGLNFKGAFFTVVRALPLLSKQASVILTGSASAEIGRLGDPLYAATKAAVRSLARTLANDEELAAKQVRFNVLSPGPVKTPLTKAAYEQAEVDAYVSAAVPLKRWADPMEVAKAALFLASDDSSYMTGSVLAVDGGLAQV